MPNIKCYADADAYLGRKDDRPLPGRYTRLVRLFGGGIAVRYHVTNVVIYYSNGLIYINSGGYKTVTTKARINTYTNARVYSRNYEWYLYPSSQEFVDGMMIQANGEPTSVTVRPLTGQAVGRGLRQLNPSEAVPILEIEDEEEYEEIG